MRHAVEARTLEARTLEARALEARVLEARVLDALLEARLRPQRSHHSALARTALVQAQEIMG